jgi:hypothetical protein
VLLRVLRRGLGSVVWLLGRRRVERRQQIHGGRRAERSCNDGRV